MKYYPIATFHYSFPEDTDKVSRVTFGYYDLSQNGNFTYLANVSSYEYYGVTESGEWALQVSSSSFGYFPTDPQFNNDVAILASSYDWIAIPTAYYTNY